MSEVDPRLQRINLMLPAEHAPELLRVIQRFVSAEGTLAFFDEPPLGLLDTSEDTHETEALIPQFTETVTDQSGQRLEVITGDTIREFAELRNYRQPNRLRGIYSGLFRLYREKGYEGYSERSETGKIEGIFPDDLGEFLDGLRYPDGGWNYPIDAGRAAMEFFVHFHRELLVVKAAQREIDKT